MLGCFCKQIVGLNVLGQNAGLFGALLTHYWVALAGSNDFYGGNSQINSWLGYFDPATGLFFAELSGFFTSDSRRTSLGAGSVLW